MSKKIMYQAYPYHQFSNDEDIVAIFKAYNQLSQEMITWLYENPFALYIRENVTGGILNYFSYCIYGQFRYKISYLQTQKISGSIDEDDINNRSLTEEIITKSYKGTSLSDDVHKRIMTWNFYKGDGLNFSIPWFKRRIMRFLTGNQGHCWKFNSCDHVSIAVTGFNVTVKISPGSWDQSLVDVLGKIINNGILNVPTMLNYIIMADEPVSDKS